jgi:hypothetical protein
MFQVIFLSLLCLAQKPHSSILDNAWLTGDPLSFNLAEIGKKCQLINRAKSTTTSEKESQAPQAPQAPANPPRPGLTRVAAPPGSGLPPLPDGEITFPQADCLQMHRTVKGGSSPVAGYEWDQNLANEAQYAAQYCALVKQDHVYVPHTQNLFITKGSCSEAKVGWWDDELPNAYAVGAFTMENGHAWNIGFSNNKRVGCAVFRANDQKRQCIACHYA